MHRELLLHLLAAYELRTPAEAAEAQRIRALVQSRERCFHRDCWPGHITGSAFVLDHSRQHFLLHHHKKLDKWLQFGGHSDGDHDPARVALREATEESGIAGLVPINAPALSNSQPGIVLPLDIDVHGIPERGNEPEHEHHDIRYAFAAPAGAEARISDESLALRWFPVAELETVIREPGLLRLARKAIALQH